MGASASANCCNVCDTTSSTEFEVVASRPYAASAKAFFPREGTEDTNDDDDTYGDSVEATIDGSNTMLEDSLVPVMDEDNLLPMRAEDSPIPGHCDANDDAVAQDAPACFVENPIKESGFSMLAAESEGDGLADEQLKTNALPIAGAASEESSPSDGHLKVSTLPLLESVLASVEDSNRNSMPNAEANTTAEVAEARRVEVDAQPIAEVAVDKNLLPTAQAGEHDKVGTSKGQDAGGHVAGDTDTGAGTSVDEAADTSADEGTDECAHEGAESWTQFLDRAASCVRESGVADEALALFESFQSTDDLFLTFATFARLHFLATQQARADAQPAPPWTGLQEAADQTARFPYQLFQELLGNNWKAKKLWTLLDGRVSRPEYAEAPCSRGRMAGRRCLVIGAGPCGLRAAIELRLLGAEVSVVEQRVTFSRINQLHIWSWCGEDLKGLGARLIEPPPKDFGSNPDLLVIAINDLQKLLLKVALLLGVEVRLGLEYCHTQWKHGGWQTLLRVPCALGNEGRAGPDPTMSSFAPPGALPPSQFVPGVLSKLAVVIGSGGFASTVGESMGIRMVETESLRKESAIGLICNVARTHGRSEADLRSFSFARQFYSAVFKHAAEETGADLENIVYVKSPVAHYFVMTPTPKSLITTGVVIDESHRPLLARENINNGKLDELVRRVIAFPFKKGEPSLLEALNKDLGDKGSFPGYADAGPRLFDFSKMRRSSEGLVFLHPAGGGDVGSAECEDNSLLVALAGDALIEPFWPEGLGIMRGFFSVLDSCYAVKQWSSGVTCAETQDIYGMAFQQLKTLSAATRARVLREDEKKFGLAPCTRYR